MDISNLAIPRTKSKNTGQKRHVLLWTSCRSSNPKFLSLWQIFDSKMISEDKLSRVLLCRYLGSDSKSHDAHLNVASDLESQSSRWNIGRSSFKSHPSHRHVFSITQAILLHDQSWIGYINLASHFSTLHHFLLLLIKKPNGISSCPELMLESIYVSAPSLFSMHQKHSPKLQYVYNQSSWLGYRNLALFPSFSSSFSPILYSKPTCGRVLCFQT